MKLAVIALSYDGTIATDDVLDPAVRHAIAEARAAGIVVLLVTGRRLDDLRRVAGDLYFVDGIVAENGAVLHFPESGYEAVLAPPLPPELPRELARRGIPYDAGACTIEARAADAPAILDVIRSRELPISLVFNRDRALLMPTAISKAVGLREALVILRLSEHGAVAIGDAENDHDLLRACEVGVAVSWGSSSLRAAADVVIDGSAPAAVATYIRSLVDRRELPETRSGRRQILLGHTDEGLAFTLAVRGRNVLVAGDARSGKSWVAGLLAEQLILQRYSVCVIDPEGDYAPLELLPGVVALGGADPLPRPRDLLRALRHAESSVVIDLSHLRYAEKVDYVAALLPAMEKLRRRTGLPNRVLLDEAHYFLSDPAIFTSFAADHHGYTLATYRASHLPRSVLDASEVVIVTCESNPEEVRALHAVCGGQEPLDAWIGALGRLPIGEAAALPITEEARGRLCRIHLAPRLTHHVRHREKYVDIPVPETRAFVFTDRGRPTGQTARTLRELVAVLESSKHPGVAAHVCRGDFSRWLANVFGDYPLAEAVQVIEARWCLEQMPHAIEAIADAVRGRYDLADDSLFAVDVAGPGFEGPGKGSPATRPGTALDTVSR